MKGYIAGNKKNPQEPTAVRDPATGKKVFDPTEIKEVVIRYLQSLLINRLPSSGFEFDLEVKRKVHERILKEIKEHEIEFIAYEMYTKTLKELSQKNGTKYEFILKGGRELKQALFFLYKKVWSNETIPETWTHTTVCQIWKRKGDQRDKRT